MRLFIKNIQAKPVHLEKIESITGKGIIAEYEGEKVFAGNLALMQAHGLTFPESLQTSSALQEKRPTRSFISLTTSKFWHSRPSPPPVKPSSDEAVRELRDMTPGAEVVAGQTLLSITNLNKVYVEAQVYRANA